jgi:hypothetical protein
VRTKQKDHLTQGEQCKVGSKESDDVMAGRVVVAGAAADDAASACELVLLMLLMLPLTLQLLLARMHVCLLPGLLA